MKTNEIIDKIKKVLKDYKERALINCEECKKESPYSIQRCIDECGEIPNNCLECESLKLEAGDFYTEAVAVLDSLVKNVASCQHRPINPLSIQTEGYPFKAVSFGRDGSFESVNVMGYCATVGWVIESKRKIGGNTCYFLKEIYPLRKK